MDDKASTRPRGRARPDPGRPDHQPGLDDAPGAPAASPLGRGANPGTVPDTYPLADPRGSIAGLRGMDVPGARGGPSGFEDRENEDVTPRARRGATEGIQSEDNEAER